MAYSMTGFGRSDGENDNFEITVEMKTVNNKYLDIQIKSPYYFNYMEEDIKKTIRKYLNRGRVDVFIKSTRKLGNTSKIVVDYELAKMINNSLKDLKDDLDIEENVKLNHILKYDGVIELKHDELDEDITRTFLLEIIENTCKELSEMRSIEGENLVKIILEQTKEMKDLVVKIKKRSPKLAEKYREDLYTKIQDVFQEFDKLAEERINLEIALFAEKSDITEEIVRLKSHIEQFEDTIKKYIPIGRKLDFIVQEMNREVNTISSKSNDTELTEYAIELKSIIEKIREQIQNLE
ncbi:YicC/YloC family endoribonuclease [Miniphocaeibacter massiliensis]|uniref:YicC/YloC family endoribonuclease n=1 Tax=Miniphocaeibacter massiliensis TaxID=2041841 RepID=UPI000C06A0D0|nr:YicC/YloC family endoribonuclease [Miniphocaeibacter massiliensis]